MKYAGIVLLAAAALAACAAHAAGPIVPEAPPDTALLQEASSPAHSRHAPCEFAPGLESPLSGKPVVAIAFGELLVDSKRTRYAYPGVAFSYPQGKAVLAAMPGAARYYPNLPGYGATIVIRKHGGGETLYAGLSRAIARLTKGRAVKVKAGEVIGRSGASSLRFEYAASGNVLAAGTQSNPCGTDSSATGTIGIMASDVAVEARFHTLSINGIALQLGPYPSGSPDVGTPETIATSNVAATDVVAATVYERSDDLNANTYYVVLCGNVVFATGHARYAGPFAYHPSQTRIAMAQPSPLPLLVFFRDSGNQARVLTAPLPSPYAYACPAPPPANTYAFAAPVFYQTGQTKYVYYYRSDGQTGDTVTLTPSDVAVVTASPSVVSVYPTAPPSWPPPANRADFTAAGAGTATITQLDSLCDCDDAPSIAVTVEATPSPAPVPTPIPNS